MWDLLALYAALVITHLIYSYWINKSGDNRNPIINDNIDDIIHRRNYDEEDEKEEDEEEEEKEEIDEDARKELNELLQRFIDFPVNGVNKKLRHPLYVNNHCSFPSVVCIVDNRYANMDNCFSLDNMKKYEHFTFKGFPEGIELMEEAMKVAPRKLNLLEILETYPDCSIMHNEEDFSISINCNEFIKCRTLEISGIEFDQVNITREDLITKLKLRDAKKSARK